MATHKFILSAGHRNTDGGGAQNEINWTYPATVALKEAIVARGGRAWIVQEHDGDNDPTFSKGRGLQSVARRCVELARELGPFDAYISMHYDSGPSGFHAICADGANDTMSLNTKDVQLARAIRDRVKATNTVKIVGWTSHSPGIMSETETHVGSLGHRLGEMVGTLGFRHETVRLILEASGYNEPSQRAFIDNPDWVRNVYCEAIVDGLEDVFGRFRDARPAPEPRQLDPVFAAPSPIAEVADLPGYVKLADGTQLVLVDYTVEAARQTPRLRLPRPDAEPIGPMIERGARFAVQYLIINPDGSLFYYTPFATRVIFNDVRPFFPDVDEALEATRVGVADALNAVREPAPAD